MGIFGFGNYNKPGPGVNKDEPPKPAPVRFFEILWRKLSKLVQANLIFFIPFIICSVLSLLLFSMGNMHIGLKFPNDSSINIWVMYVVPLPFVFLSPFISGLTIISRNFAREEHAFVWSDFFKAVKANWKYSLINGIICYIAWIVLSFSITYYYSMLEQNKLFYLPLAICLVIGLLFIFAQYYVSIMIVMFDLTLKKIYKNSFIFAVLGIGRNLMITAIWVGLLYLFYAVLPFSGLMILVAIFLCAFIFFSFFSFLINFSVYPLIERYLIQPYQEQQNQSKHEQTAVELSDRGEEDLSFAQSEEEADPDAYVYVNGRLMKKSEADKYQP